MNWGTFIAAPQGASTELGNHHAAPIGFPCGSADKEYACNEGELGSIPGLGRSPGDGKGYPLQSSGLYSPWGRTQLNDFHIMHQSNPETRWGI